MIMIFMLFRTRHDIFASKQGDRAGIDLIGKIKLKLANHGEWRKKIQRRRVTEQKIEVQMLATTLFSTYLVDT
jgi:hypothetical protein